MVTSVKRLDAHRISDAKNLADWLGPGGTIDRLNNLREVWKDHFGPVGLATLDEGIQALRDCRAALASDAGEKTAAVIRAAREWRRSRRTGAEDWPASVDLAAAVDALDGYSLCRTEYCRPTDTQKRTR